uniref:Uncharacterized protein n=1 Tax=Anguilla anguilla TaxID=7936 RepID=A0A0E9V6G2_ANGAN
MLWFRQPNKALNRRLMFNHLGQTPVRPTHCVLGLSVSMMGFILRAEAFQRIRS